MTPQDIATGYFTIGILALASVAVFYRLHPEAGAELNDR
jgi:hypothetical protein